MIRRLATTLVAAILILPAAARAQADACAGAADAAAVGAALGGPTDRAAVQAGLRAIFGADEGGLADGIVGPVTLARLGELCATIPLAEGTEPVEGALDLARRYAELSQAAPDWRLSIADPALLDAEPGFRRDVVRLAGSAASVSAALTGAKSEDGCGAIDAGALVLTPAAVAHLEAGTRALAVADPALQPEAGLAEVCALYPALAGPAALADDLVRLGRIEAEIPGAAAILGAPEFAAWLAAAPVPRTTRLLGTVPAVVALLAEYRGAVPPAAEGVAAADVCPERQAADGPTYFALTPADIEALTARAGMAAALAPVAEERFDDRDALVAAIGAVLGVSAPDCAARLVEAAVTRHADAGTVYSLDAAEIQTLALEPELAGLLPAVSPLQNLESGSRDQLAAGLEAAIRGSVAAAVGAAAGVVADSAAAVAEDVSPAPDTPAPGIPAAAPAERPAEFAITDTSLLLLEPEVEDRAFFEAISASPYNPLPSRELVRSDMLAALAPVVASRADTLARDGLEGIVPGVRPRWRLSAEVTAELASNPVFAPVAPKVLAAVGGLSGIAYPNARLFEQVLASLPVEVAGAARGAILEVAEKRVADPYVRRGIGPVADADCGCNEARRDHALVYGFFPFWQFDARDPAATPRVDFELVGRIAFDGLVLGRNAELNYAPQWNDAAATFTVSAHRHQAAVDLGIRLVGWRDWSPEQVRTAADRVIAELGRRRATDTLVASSGALGWLDPWLDRRVDGVTLIAEGYTGNPATGGRADNLIALVRMIAAGIEGSGQEINLAFDIPLADEATVHDPLLQDLHGLIVDIERPEARPVKRILVFLERRTTQSKKNLRLRVENSFKGEERIQVLRSIVPVVPPGANAVLAQEHHAASETVTATTEAVSFGQFRDDVVYFQDNFAGIGFWPAPAAGAVLPDGSPDKLGEIVTARYYAWTPPLIPAGLRAPVGDGVDGVCTIVCPNRLAFHLASVGAAGLIGGLLLLGLYSGRLRSASRRLFLVPILMLALLALLVVTVTCDAASRSWLPGVILAMAMLMSGSVVFHWYERRVDGPMP